jgi:hypothetical protein
MFEFRQNRYLNNLTSTILADLTEGKICRVVCCCFLLIEPFHILVVG